MSSIDFSMERFLFNINTLTELGDEIAAPNDFNRSVKSTLYMIMGSVFASKGVVYKYDHDKKILYPIASKGIDSIREVALKLTDGEINEFVKYNKPLDTKSDNPLLPLFSTARAELEKFGTRIITIMAVRNELIGIIAVNDKFSGEEYTVYDFQLLSVMAQHMAFNIHNHSLLTKLMHKYNENKDIYENLKRVYQDTIIAFATAIDAKDAYTKGHSYRVSAYGSALAREMGWANEDIESVRVAGLVHDIGKLAIDKSIINKVGQLVESERQELFSHPIIGYDILSKVKFPWKSIPAITRNHHEKIDGSGYPDRLKEFEIPTGAKIIALVDSFDAMTTNRPYRPKLPFATATEEIKKNCGKQFDADIAHTFASLMYKEVLKKSGSPAIISHLSDHVDPLLLSKFIESFEVHAVPI